MSVRVLIVGYGFLGEQLAQILRADNHVVYGIKRQPINNPSAQIIHKDILQLTDQDLPEVDFIVYCPSPDQRDDLAYQQLFVTGLEQVVSIYTHRILKPRLLYISSTRVYEQQNGQWVNEESLCASTDPLARRLLAGEAIAQYASLDSIIIRFSGIYGVNRHYLLNALQSGNARLCHSQKFSNRIHILDCARTLYHLMRTSYHKDIYIASDSEPTPINTIISWLSATLGIPIPAEKKQASVEPGDHQSNKRLDNTRLLQTGFRFEFANYRQGFKQILQATGQLPAPEEPPAT
jgi:nucleoside-diphosphate-sugar epimerase